MQITGINNMYPGNQGVTVYFDGMDMSNIQSALAMWIVDFSNHLATEDLEPETRSVREHQLDGVEDLYAQFIELNEYLDSINTNLVLDSYNAEED